MRRQHVTRGLAALMLWIAGGASLAARAAQQPPPPPPPPNLQPQPAGPGAPGDLEEGGGVQALTRGPIHEAFAEPVVFDPKLGPTVPKEPPPPVEEVPPAEKPEGANVQWIPGYWAWDDQRNDYVWVSGLWRDVPPGRQWMPGYSSRAEGGFQWTPGFWADASQGQGQAPGQDPNQDQGQLQLQYLPAQSRHGYDPLFEHYAAEQGRGNPNWMNDLHEQYRYRRDHAEARPPATFAQTRGLREADGGPGRNLVLARPIHQLASGSNAPFRYEHLEDARRRELAQQAARLRQVRDQRVEREAAHAGAQARQAPAAGPRQIALPRSPILAHAGAPGGPGAGAAGRAAQRALPPAPERPHPDRNIPHPGPGQAQPRFEPHPDRLPPGLLRPGQARVMQEAPPRPRGGEVPKAAPRPEQEKAERKAELKAERRQQLPERPGGEPAKKKAR
jgi:hypothetical protein